MKDDYKTKRQLIIELEELRHRLSELQTDVTERNRSEDQRNEEYVFLQKLIDTIPTPIFYKDRRGKYLGCNKSFEEYIGLTKNEIVGKTVYDIAPKELADKYYKMDEDLFLHPGNQFYEYSVQYADGTLHDVIFNKSTLSNLDGDIAGLVGVMVDITDRKRAEEELCKREELLHGIFTSAHIVIWAIDRNGVFTLSEGMALKALGLKPGEIVGQSLFAIYQDYPEIIDDNRRALAGESFISTVDVAGIVFESWYSPLKDKAGKIIGAFGVATDITERVKIEKALKDSEERYRVISENTSDYFYSLSVSSQGTISVDWIGGAFERITGYTAEEISDLEKWLSIVHPDDLRIIRQAAEKVLSNQPTHVEYRLITKAGNEIWLRDYSRSIGDDKQKGVVTIIGAVKEVTERKKAEEALQQSEEQYRRLVEGSPDIIYSFSNKRGGIYYSPRVESMLGYSVSHLYENPFLWHESIHPDDLIKVDTIIEELKRNNSFEVEYRIKDAQGDWHWFRDRSIGLSSMNNETIVSGLATDITEKRQLEAQLLHSQKIEAVGQLAGGVAHDFNNILTAIIGYGNLMQKKINKDDPLWTNLDNILTGADRAAHLTQSLLAFSRKQIIETKPVDLNNIVRPIEKILLRIIGEDIELITQLTVGHLTISADSGQIEQVLMNLATNARDTMPEGGRLLIETKQVEIDNEFIATHGFGKPGQYALLTVSDTGEGIDEETRERIFEPFFTTKEVGKGTGLGLSITYGIVKQHNGYINVSSKLGEGTTFQIYLQLIQAGVKEAESEELHAPEGGTETILIAEDDENIREFMKEALTAHGYNIIDSYDGEDAINKFIENEENIQLLISDVIMPKKNGKEVYDAIKKRRSDMKALFLSGYDADKIQIKGVLEEGLHFVYKPISLNNLLLKVREVLDK